MDGTISVALKLTDCAVTISFPAKTAGRWGAGGNAGWPPSSNY